MKTMENWNESKKNFSEFITNNEEIDEEIYYYFLGILPPEQMLKGGFLVGEPHNHNNEGYPTYAGFTRRAGRYYFLGHLTKKEFKESV